MLAAFASPQNEHARAAVTMAAIDRMPPAVRALVNEYGFQIVSHMRQSFDDPDDLAANLELWRYERQRQWLATDFLARRQPGQYPIRRRRA